MTSAFPGKGSMILQRVHPPLLETPMDVFDKSVFTPNDQFFVRWHWADIPTSIDVESFRLNVFGHVNRPLSISLAQLLRLPRVEMAAVNQCSGNSRGLFQPRVAGAQWGNGAMGNAKWMGVPLRHVLDLAGVRGGATAVRVGGMDKPLVAGAARARGRRRDRSGSASRPGRRARGRPAPAPPRRTAPPTPGARRGRGPPRSRARRSPRGRPRPAPPRPPSPRSAGPGRAGVGP